jgi:hypothetical protein
VLLAVIWQLAELSDNGSELLRRWCAVKLAITVGKLPLARIYRLIEVITYCMLNTVHIWGA